MARKNYKCLHTQFFPSHSRPIFTLPLCFIPSLLFPSPFLPLVQPSCPSSSSSSEARVPRVRMTNNEGKKKQILGPSTHFLLIPPPALALFAVPLACPLRPSSPLCRPECQEEEAGVGRAPRRRRREGGRATCPLCLALLLPDFFPWALHGLPKAPRNASRRGSLRRGKHKSQPQEETVNDELLSLNVLTRGKAVDVA